MKQDKNWDSNSINHFKLYIRNDPEGRDENLVILNFWCFNPKLAFEKLIKRNINSILLTSGTMQPFNSYSQSL